MFRHLRSLPATVLEPTAANGNGVFSAGAKLKRITRIILIAAGYTVFTFTAMLVYIWVRIAYPAN